MDHHTFFPRLADLATTTPRAAANRRMPRALVSSPFGALPAGFLPVGQPGRGKTASIGAILARWNAAGEVVWVHDPADAYDAIRHVAGAEPLRIGPGRRVRINPLEPRR